MSKFSGDKLKNVIDVKKKDSQLHTTQNKIFVEKKCRRKFKNFNRPWQGCEAKIRRGKVKGE